MNAHVGICVTPECWSPEKITPNIFSHLWWSWAPESQVSMPKEMTQQNSQSCI